MPFDSNMYRCRYWLNISIDWHCIYTIDVLLFEISLDINMYIDRCMNRGSSLFRVNDIYVKYACNVL